MDKAYHPDHTDEYRYWTIEEDLKGENRWRVFDEDPDPIHPVLYNMTELVYKVPQNTSLVEVLGPVGGYPYWWGRSECYATFQPRPSWLKDDVLPTSVSAKVTNVSEVQTMFLLPLAPDVEYTLYLGGVSHQTSCPISAIRSYPYEL